MTKDEALQVIDNRLKGLDQQGYVPGDTIAARKHDMLWFRDLVEAIDGDPHDHENLDGPVEHMEHFLFAHPDLAAQFDHALGNAAVLHAKMIAAHSVAHSGERLT